VRNRKPKERKTKKPLVAVATAFAVVGAEIMGGNEKAKHIQLQEAEQPAVLTYWVNSTSTVTQVGELLGDGGVRF
jgi:hypothetical protein